MKAESILAEFRKRREPLRHVEYQSAHTRIGAFYKYCISVPLIEKIISENKRPINQFLKGPEPHRSLEAGSLEDIVSVGLYLIEECYAGKNLYSLAMSYGICGSIKFQECVDAAMAQYIYHTLDFLEDRIKQAVGTPNEPEGERSKEGTAYGGRDETETEQVSLQEIINALKNLQKSKRTVKDIEAAKSALPPITKAYDIICRHRGECGAKTTDAIGWLSSAARDGSEYYHSLLNVLIDPEVIADMEKWQGKQAVETPDGSVDNNKKKVDELVSHAKAHIERNEYEDALYHLDEALKHTSNMSYILLEKGIVYGRMGQNEKELSCYDQAIKHNPKYIQAYMQKAHVLQQNKQYEEAIECLRKGIDNDLEPEKEATLWHNLASVYLWVKDYQEAYKSINRSLELHDNEHGRMVRDAIRKDMLSKGKPESTDKKLSHGDPPTDKGEKYERLRQRFIEFLRDKKKFPPETIWVNEKGGFPDLSIIEVGADRPILLIEFKTLRSRSDLRNASLQLQEHKIKQGLQERLSYIVLPGPNNLPESFEIVKVEDDGFETILINDFPDYETLRRAIEVNETPDTNENMAIFKSKLTDIGKNLLNKLLELIKNDSAFIIEPATSNYINIKIKKPTRVAMQIHREINDYSQLVLAIAGWQKNNPKIKNKFSIVKRDIDRLSGLHDNPREYAWLRGKLESNVKDNLPPYQAKVYIIDPSVSQDDNAWAELDSLLKFAKENAEKKISENLDEEQNGEDATFGNFTVTGDKKSQEDRLGRKGLVNALADMFTHTKDKDVEGFTVALLGDWGEGKSTVMELLGNKLKELKFKKNESKLRKSLRKIFRNKIKELEEQKFEFATFNAWEYEHTDNIAAGLAQEVINGLTQSFGFLKRQRLQISFAYKVYKDDLLRSALYLAVAIVLLMLVNWLGGESIFKKLGLAGGTVAIATYLFITLKHIIDHPLATKLGTYLNLPNYDKHLGLIPIMKKHISKLCNLQLGNDKRLVVFVDDLDRCHHECISKTMDAIRLVMAIPNVIVMIGIDHRIAFKAIEKFYKKLEDGYKNNITADIARDYLGKIIQLPIRLMPVNSKDLEQFINEKLFHDAINIEKPVKTVLPSGVPDEESHREVTPPLEALPKNEVVDTQKNLMNSQEMQETIGERDKFYDLAERFKFTNPRQLLRLRNSYRLLKALDLQHSYKKNSLMTMLFWQEFLHNFPLQVRNECMAILSDKNRINKIESSKIIAIATDVYNDIKKLFDNSNYNKMAEFARVVVLPHSKEGVLDTKEEIQKWIDKNKN